MYPLLKALVGIQAVVFILAAVAHVGLPVPVLGETRLIPAAVVEALCGLGFLYASLHGGARTAFAAEAAGFAGVLLALALLTLEQAPRTPLTDLTYVVLLGLAGPGLLIADRLARGR
jgi:hypothetical protein